MARKEPPARPYVDVKHEHVASLKAYEEAGTMLYNVVGSILSLADRGVNIDVDKVIEMLREQHANFRKAAYGE